MTAAPGPALVWCPFANPDEARSTASVLLDEGLIACANILPEMESHFVWNGLRDTAREAGALLKTNCDMLEKVVARLEVLHPYAQPAIVGWRCDVTTPATAAWLGGLGDESQD